MKRGGERWPKPAGVSMKRTPSSNLVKANPAKPPLQPRPLSGDRLVVVYVVVGRRGRRGYDRAMRPVTETGGTWRMDLCTGHRDYETETTLASFASFFPSVRLNVSTNGFEYQDHGCNISRLPFWMLGEVVLHRILVARSCSHLRELGWYSIHSRLELLW